MKSRVQSFFKNLQRLAAFSSAATILTAYVVSPLFFSSAMKAARAESSNSMHFVVS